MNCIIDDIKEIRQSIRKKMLDTADIYFLLNKILKNKCCGQCQIRQAMKQYERTQTDRNI